jgi:hypothetical protein
MTVATDLYDELVQDVITLTARPDLELEAELAVRTATNNAHLSDAYARDFQLTPVQLPNASYQTSLDIPTLFPRLRGLGSIQPLDNNYQPVILPPENRISIIELGDIYDDYGTMKNNVAYLSGDKVNIRSSTNGYGYLVGWFRAPSTKRDQYSSWIAQLYPDVILYWAASIVLDTNGNEAKAAKFMRMTLEIHVPFLKANFLLGELR